MFDAEAHPERERQADPGATRYREKRMAHWNQVSRQKGTPRRPGAYYHQLLQHYYKFLIPPGLRIIGLGCGHTDLLDHLKPSIKSLLAHPLTHGLEIDSSEMTIRRARIIQQKAFLKCFERDREVLELKFPNWRVENISLHFPLSYLLSEGISYRVSLPAFLF